MTGRRWWIACALVFCATLAATAPSVGDFGLTYDEPAYRYSQMRSIQWWERLSHGEFRAIMEPDALLYYWPYAQHGINFHPPLAGQLNLLTYKLFGGVLKDIPARRMASVIEFSLTVTILFGFLVRRYDGWTGIVAAGSLLLMPRLFGQAHLIDTDTPGLLLWAAATCAFWKGLTEPNAGRWRVALGVIVGLAFVEKMGAVLVVLPILGWLALTALPRSIARRDRSAWVDGLIATTAMLVPLGLAYREIRRLEIAYLTLQSRLGVTAKDLSPARTDLFRDHPQTWMPGAILLVPLLIWLLRGLFLRLRRRPPAPRPALEIWLALLAFGPAIAWLGNPGWWREALPRLAHYHAISMARRGVLPDIQIIYFGQIYEYSLPWHNAWVLIAITVPASILLASIAGLFLAPWRDRLPLFFVLNLITLPVMRMLPTPAHDGVRLFLPTFFFLAAFAGWGTRGLARLINRRWAWPVVAGAVLLPAAWGLIRVHPYELSYYNEIIGGPRGAWEKGFELSYWYDAFTDDVLADLNARLPRGASLMYANEKSEPIMVPQDQQLLGVLRGDLQFDLNDSFLKSGRSFPYLMQLTHDSKADGFTRILFVMTPWYSHAPRQFGGARVVAVFDPVVASRAWALQLLVDREDHSPPDPPAAPDWIRKNAPPLARLWGDGVTKVPRLGVEPTVLDWARDDPESLRAAARWIATKKTAEGSEPARRLMAVLNRYRNRTAMLLRARPEALPEAVEILIRRPEALRRILLHQAYLDPKTIGGYLD
ncbi:MAG: hypothetical protein JWN86_4733 [Planctomycetota bacterium]|nr:hypothetical protein [Planctomycetota bacterium]